MNKIYLIAGVAMLLVQSALAQPGQLPVTEWTSGSQAALVLYISGDGGLNDFSTGICSAINQAGYKISAVNARSYFWTKKTPEQATADIAAYLTQLLSRQSSQHFILAGYSFGADVLPFIVNRFPAAIQKKLQSVVLLSPTTSTDFEVHWSDMLGGSTKRKLDVIKEISRMQVPKTAILVGSEEKNFPVSAISINNYYNRKLPGGHHFEGNTKEVASIMLSYFK